MIDWKPGDELVCVRAGLKPDLDGHDKEHCLELFQEAARLISEGRKYVFDGFAPDGGVHLLGVYPRIRAWFDLGYDPDRFRKVERKTDKQSLTEWLSQPAGDTDRIDRSAPIAPRKRERA